MTSLIQTSGTRAAVVEAIKGVDALKVAEEEHHHEDEEQAEAGQHRLYPLRRLGWPDDDRKTRVVLIGQDIPQRQICELFEVLAPRGSRRSGHAA